VVYIERDFPTDVIDEIAWSESNSRKPIYHMHKWFARRVGCTFRAMILASFSDENPMSKFYSRTDLLNSSGTAPIILDPFMGGGTTLVEGHRLGCKVIGTDVNPVAWFITKKELESLDSQLAKKEFYRIDSAIGERLRSFYNTRCSNGHKAEIMYSFWVRCISCLECGGEVPLFKTFLIARLAKQEAIYYCPDCAELAYASLINPKCDCGKNLDVGYATNKSYTCPHCSFTGDITEAWLSSGEKPLEEIFAIEFLCEECGRGYKTPDSEDYNRFEICTEELNSTQQDLIGKLIPQQIVPWYEMSTMRPRCRVYKHFYDFFNDRQLLSLTAILNEILKIEDRNLREFFLLTFSDSLNANNMFCIYNTAARKLEPLFGGHYFSPPMMPVENNVWGAKRGRGSFSKYFAKGLRAIAYQIEPFEIEFRKSEKGRERVRKPVANDSIGAYYGRNFIDLLGDADALLKCTSSENLEFIPDKGVDAVITDPPYYDNIMYSELSNLFYCWLRLGLMEDYPDVFGPMLSGRTEEILIQPKTGKGKQFYVESMVRVFSEMHRVLMDDGHLIFVFQHKKLEAWLAILQILVESKFFVTAVYPSHGETPSGVRAHGINYNAILVCKKTSNITKRSLTKSVEEEMDLEIRITAERHSDLDSKDALMVSLGKALQVYSQRYALDSATHFDWDHLGSFVQECVDRYW